jgi:hypothetical protein
MSPSVTSIDEIDLEISIAYIALGGARGLWQRSPTTENALRVDEAEAAVDLLLDRRLAAQP